MPKRSTRSKSRSRTRSTTPTNSIPMPRPGPGDWRGAYDTMTGPQVAPMATGSLWVTGIPEYQRSIGYLPGSQTGGINHPGHGSWFGMMSRFFGRG